MKKLIFFIAFISMSYFSFGQTIDLSKYNKKQKAIITKLNASLSKIASVNTIGKEANEHIENLLPLFVSGARMTINRNGGQYFYLVEDYLNKVKLLKLYIEPIEVEFDQKNKIKGLVIDELNDIRG